VPWPWIKDHFLKLLIAAALVVAGLAAAARALTVQGLLTVLTIAAGTGIWIRQRTTSRRAAADLARKHRELHEQSCLAAADAMSGEQFEDYVADLMRMDGYQQVRVIGGANDGGADILAADPSGRLVAVQCKRQSAPVPIGVVRELNGTVGHEHQGRTGLLVTTALLTGPAARLAGQTAITVVDRTELARWMSRARLSIEQRDAPVE
jgi:restriction system protein